MKESSISMQ